MHIRVYSNCARHSLSFPAHPDSSYLAGAQVRQASRDAALREVKDRAKKAKAEKIQAAGKGASKAPVAKAVPKGKGR